MKAQGSHTVVRALQALDGWVKPYLPSLLARGHTDSASRAFEAARRQATIERLEAGLDAWNDWAFQAQSLRRQARGSPVVVDLIASVTTADLSGHVFDGLTDLGSFHFPSTAIFTKVRFRRDVWFADAKFHGPADFSGAEFEGKAWFEFAKLTGAADFSDALFARTAEFRNARFLGGASFERATFLDAWFRGSEWRGDVTFRGARFAGEAGLGDCRWYGACDFSEMELADNAGFDTSTFAGPVTFAGTRFRRNARFDGTTFAAPPVFDRASFATKPVPEDVVQPPMGSPVHDQIGEIRRRLGTR